jgi:hypothetical protein
MIQFTYKLKLNEQVGAVATPDNQRKTTLADGSVSIASCLPIIRPHLLTDAEWNFGFLGT